MAATFGYLSRVSSSTSTLFASRLAALPNAQGSRTPSCRSPDIKKSTKSIHCRCASSPQVVVTREASKNAKLVRALENSGIYCLEFPLIEHIKGPDLDKLPSVLCENHFDWILITSPEAGTLFSDAWRAAGCPLVRVGVVGEGTADALNSSLNIEFSPSKATGKVLASELPKLKEGCTVLYPASMKASKDIEQELSMRGFRVMRLNTYSTVTVSNINQDIAKEAVSLPVVALASPSAVQGWAKIVSKPEEWSGALACIGEISGACAQRLGFKKVYYPSNPGIDGWVESIASILKSQNLLRDLKQV